MINHARWSDKCKAKRSYQLRTGQMKLPVRKIEPVQYVDSKNGVYQELPRHPILGEVYKFRDKLVKCEISIGDCGNRKYIFYDEECDGYIPCTASRRNDNTNIYIAPYNA